LGFSKVPVFLCHPVLTPKWQCLDCATVAFSERYTFPTSCKVAELHIYVQQSTQFETNNTILADPSGRAVNGVGFHSFDHWDLGFESRTGHGCSPLVFVECCVRR
jgi:hypothetical protein